MQVLYLYNYTFALYTAAATRTFSTVFAAYFFTVQQTRQCTYIPITQIYLYNQCIFNNIKIYYIIFVSFRYTLLVIHSYMRITYLQNNNATNIGSPKLLRLNLYMFSQGDFLFSILFYLIPSNDRIFTRKFETDCICFNPTAILCHKNCENPPVNT